MLVIKIHEVVSQGISFMLKVSPYAGGQKLKGALLCPASVRSYIGDYVCAAIIGEYAHQS
jgi:hypothetical protein